MTQRRPATDEPQPGERDPAPGDLALVQSFVNSRWDLASDLEEQWRDPEHLARWLRERGLLERSTRLRDADLQRALEVREGLRGLLFAHNGAPLGRDTVEGLNRGLGRIALGVAFDPGGAPDLIPLGRGLDGALASLAAIVSAARIDGTWRRLKACGGPHCGWAFYDHSRNQSGSWCSMSACGQRSKAREYRRRRRVPRRGSASAS